ncbi:fructosyl-amino acid oxidase [Moelleriella libera RCEF 2490]|uniref:Fructosyl-amino acid oxidase n=1 Tax=Moelleriella libera RCEF 2490 TaxID=1081109 RepID=A0A168CMC2_9HYPO|nr:fructosyl-amino acid oxidase [Moelleriella libera RCEF 2490]
MEGNPPSSILIVGSGVFGLSTAWALTKRPLFAKTSITVVDDTTGGQFPPEDCASIDSSRIVRADYADPHYAALANEAQREWRKQGVAELGGQGRYTESGLILTAYVPEESKTGQKSGMAYTQESWKNCVEIAVKEGHLPGEIETLDSAAALGASLGTDTHAGDWGYLNPFSGWADAGKGMKWLFEQVTTSGRVEFVEAKVGRLKTRGGAVTGVQLLDGRLLDADVVLVAAGAWTGTLIDLRGQVEATGQALGYVDISDEELAVLSEQPVVLNLSSGLFIIPPQGRTLKVARHGFGYLNPSVVHGALPSSPLAEQKPIVVSRPRTSRNGLARRLPHEADMDLRRGLAQLSPVKGLEKRPWKETRLCWYSDTRDGDWLVDWHPGWKGLFIATGDSGHGYKFLPVLGEKVLDCMLGQGGLIGEKWKWKEVDGETVGKETDGKFNGLVTMDGSRGGLPGMILAEEMQKERYQRGVKL